jgi:hypothetical protein
MSDDKFHFKIPNDKIRNVKYEKTGGGISVQRVDHSEHGLNIKTQTNQLKEAEFAKKDSTYTSDIFLQIETPSDVSLKSQKLKIEELGFEVLSYSSSNRSIGTARMKKDELAKFEEKLDGYISSKDHVGKTYFSPIEQISSIPPESKIKTEIDYDSDKEIDVIINLFNALSPKERLAVSGSILEELRAFTEIVEQHNFSNGISSIEVRIQEKHIPQIVSEFTTIKEIKPNHTFFVEASTPAETLPNPLDILPVLSSSKICIIDSGISSANGIFDALVDQRLNTFLPKGSVDSAYDHGTFVASRCLFGDNIDDCLGSHQLQPYCKVIDIPVFGIDASGNKTYPNEFGLRKAIESVVSQFSDTVKVYNLSLGAPNPIMDNQFTELAKLLDYLSKAYKVLFVVAAGNIDSLLGNFPSEHYSSPLSRIGCPAESLLSLTVGAIAKYTNAQALSDANIISPFSRIGPGADLGIKPEVVAHGGNLITPYTKTPRVATYGISHNGSSLAVDNGTSYSAPIISQYAQQLFDCYPESDPNLVKGLLCHFSESRSIHDEIIDSERNYVGFGEPNLLNAIKASDHNAAFICEGQLDQENYQFIPFHVPNTLAAEEQDTKLSIKITVTYDPPVNPDNETEYSNARISAKLIKPTESGNREINITGENNYNLPWNPIIQFEKSFSRSYLCGEWDLRLRLYTRGNVSKDYLQDYSVVIEIIDLESGTSVYDDIEKEFGSIYERIKIQLAA